MEHLPGVIKVLLRNISILNLDDVKSANKFKVIFIGETENILNSAIVTW